MEHDISTERLCRIGCRCELSRLAILAAGAVLAHYNSRCWQQCDQEGITTQRQRGLVVAPHFTTGSLPFAVVSSQYQCFYIFIA